MRIIAGRFRRRRLKSVPGYGTRPTSDYNREMVFATEQDVRGKKILDLFAGTGSIGLEALSRGAKWVDFVEFANVAVGTILDNVKTLDCSKDCHVYRKKVESYIQSCEEKYDIIYLDPPYNKGLVNPILKMIFERDMLSEGGMIIVEHAKYEDISPEFMDYVYRVKKGKDTRFSWLDPALEHSPDNS